MLCDTGHGRGSRDGETQQDKRNSDCACRKYATSQYIFSMLCYTMGGGRDVDEL